MKKYFYDGMAVTIQEEKPNGAVMVQPVDDHGKDYGEAFAVSKGELKDF